MLLELFLNVLDRAVSLRFYLCDRLVAVLADFLEPGYRGTLGCAHRGVQAVDAVAQVGDIALDGGEADADVRIHVVHLRLDALHIVLELHEIALQRGCRHGDTNDSRQYCRLVYTPGWATMRTR